LDTKWKVFSGTPSDSDIQQMFVYCKRLKNVKNDSTQKAFLVYPGSESKVVVEAEEYYQCTDSKMGVITVSIPELLEKYNNELNSLTIFNDILASA
ncbi:MAG TPA: hypothetical protein PKV35_10020, partial [bacterium]|nr:hypothetical protein [bacterium]